MSNPTLVARYTPGTPGSLTVTLQNPPASGSPSSAVVTIAGGTIAVPLTNNQGSVPLTLHGALANARVAGNVVLPPADQTVPATPMGVFTLGSATGAAIESQLLPPAASGDPYLIAPTQDSILRAYHFGFLGTNAQQRDILTAAIQDLYVMMSMMAEFQTATVAPALQQSTWAPIDLTADQKNALALLQSDVLPNLSQTLATVAPTTGTPSVPFSGMVGRSAGWKAALGGYIQDKTSIPNLKSD